MKKINSLIKMEKESKKKAYIMNKVIIFSILIIALSSCKKDNSSDKLKDLTEEESPKLLLDLRLGQSYSKSIKKAKANGMYVTREHGATYKPFDDEVEGNLYFITYHVTPTKDTVITDIDVQFINPNHEVLRRICYDLPGYGQVIEKFNKIENTSREELRQNFEDGWWYENKFLYVNKSEVKKIISSYQRKYGKPQSFTKYKNGLFKNIIWKRGEVIIEINLKDFSNLKELDDSGWYAVNGYDLKVNYTFSTKIKKIIDSENKIRLKSDEQIRLKSNNSKF